MINLKHSPAPWNLDWNGGRTHPDFPELHYVNVHSHEWINHRPAGLSITGYMRKADAHLIAQAPDLLKALKSCVDVLIVSATGERDRALAAIAKAEGRS